MALTCLIFGNSLKQDIIIQWNLKNENSLTFTVINKSLNRLLIIGPQISAEAGGLQTYWLEAHDIEGKKLISKLPQTFQLEVKDSISVEDTYGKVSVKKEIDPVELRRGSAKIDEMVKSGEGVKSFSGPAEKNDQVGYVPSHENKESPIINLNEWFDFEFGKTYEVIALFKPSAEIPIISSAPLCVTLENAAGETLVLKNPLTIQSSKLNSNEQRSTITSSGSPSPEQHGSALVPQGINTSSRSAVIVTPSTSVAQTTPSTTVQSPQQSSPSIPVWPWAVGLLLAVFGGVWWKFLRK